MAVWQLLLLSAVLELPLTELNTLKGESIKGRLAEISASQVTLRDSQSSAPIPLADILEIRFTAEPLQELPPAPATLVTLLDGTRMRANKFSVAGNQASLETEHYGRFKIPTGSIASVRFGAPNSKVDATWDALLQRDSKSDLLVVKKGEILDQLSGVVGDVGPKVKLLLDGDEIPVNSEKVYGIVYARRPQPTRKAGCEVELRGGDVLQTSQVVWDGTALKAKLLAGPEVAVPIDRVRAFDFSAGKLRYLSQLEPREVKYVPYFDVVWEYRRDKNLDGGPLRMAGKSYSRGLGLHSRTLLRYRLAGEYSRFQAVMGIDDVVDRRGDVHVVISGDSKVLFEGDVRGTDSPRPLDLNVQNVRDLEILVDFGGDLDIADHLDLADAKVIK